ncbi:hypothetical protein TTRE_0000780401 [Trichuris trichiura]|uniref:Uncharacterized protein n=1 Tax=Trichuris trichiura TaxID=36087 RepID=A0A077ZLE5_TRITR|nr:hypothetical protein TTRE_0000780401 [Trichuris trichiura]
MAFAPSFETPSYRLNFGLLSWNLFELTGPDFVDSKDVRNFHKRSKMAYETYAPFCVTAPKNLPSERCERSVQVEDNVDDDAQEEQFTEFDVVDEDEVEEDSAAATADVIMRNNGGVEGDFDEEIRQLIDNYDYDSVFFNSIGHQRQPTHRGSWDI